MPDNGDDETCATSNLANSLESMERKLDRMRPLQERMMKLGYTAGKATSLGRLADQISLQQSAIDRIRSYEGVVPKIPTIPPVPPNPILETNRRLERIENRFEQMQSIAVDAAEIGTGLQGAAAEFLQKFEKAANNNDRAARRAIKIGAAAVIIAVAMPAVQIFYSEIRGQPSSWDETQASLDGIRSELAAIRDLQSSASDRLADALATSDGETAAVLQEIYELLSGAEEVASETAEELMP